MQQYPPSRKTKSANVWGQFMPLDGRQITRRTEFIGDTGTDLQNTPDSIHKNII